jgi:hypothetical protein
MARSGILAALRERDRSGRASSWTSPWPTARCRGWRWTRCAPCRASPAARGDGARRALRLLPALRVRRRLGDPRRPRPKFFARSAAASARGPLDCSSRRPGSAGPTPSSRRLFRERPTREQWAAFAAEHECWPGTRARARGGSLDSELVRERGMVVELDQPGRRPVRLLGPPSSSAAETPTRHAAGHRAWGRTRRPSSRGGLDATRSRRCVRRGRARPPGGRSRGSFLS